MKHHTLRVTGGLVALAVLGGPGAVGAPPAPPEPSVRPAGVCPPFHLRDEQGGKIDPVRGSTRGSPTRPARPAARPAATTTTRSPAATTSPRGRARSRRPTSARYAWASSPGNFGGNWCSPAPLYRYLSPKDNESARADGHDGVRLLHLACGTCHPGGGSAEHDRSGKRYDRGWPIPASGFSPGAENRFDGDYYKARWSETGVLEADCLLCHLPGYDYAERQAQLGAWNLRWAATAGAKLAAVTGSVKDGQAVEVAYDPAGSTRTAR
jgi:hypothetical protein